MKLNRVLEIINNARPIFIGLLFIGIGGGVSFLFLRDYATQGTITIGQIVWVIVWLGASLYLFYRGVRDFILHL